MLTVLVSRIDEWSGQGWNQGKLISHKVFFKSFRRSQLPKRSVNVSFTITNIKNKLTDYCDKRESQYSEINLWKSTLKTLFVR